MDVEDERTYSGLLEKKLKKAFPDISIEVINAGVFGYSVRQGLIYASEILPMLRPQVITIAFGRNDYRSNIFRFRMRLLSTSDYELMQGNINNGFEKIKLPFFKRVEAGLFKLDIFSLSLLGYQHLQIIHTVNQFTETLDRAREYDFAHNFSRKIEPSKSLDNVKMPPRYYQNDLLEFCKLAKKYNAIPILIVNWGVMIEDYRDANHIVGGWEKVPVIDLYDRFEKFTDISYLESRPEYSEDLEFYKAMLGESVLKENKSLLITTDWEHPNRIGHRIIAEEIHTVIMNLLSESRIPVTGSEK